MTFRDNLVVQVEQALKVSASVSATDYTGMANAAVDAMSVFIFEQLIAGPGA